MLYVFIALLKMLSLISIIYMFRTRHAGIAQQLSCLTQSLQYFPF